MALVNRSSREICCKIVYYGPKFSGKQTNLSYIDSQVHRGHHLGCLPVCGGTNESPQIFDRLHLDLGIVQGFKTVLWLYAVPGEVEYNASRKLILKYVDGIVFVVDSDVSKAKENIESLQNMIDNLAADNLTLDNIPWVLQYNKRDMANAMPIERLEKDCNTLRIPSFEAVASEGLGVFTTLKAINKLVLNRLSLAPACRQIPDAHKMLSKSSDTYDTYQP